MLRRSVVPTLVLAAVFAFACDDASTLEDGGLTTPDTGLVVDAGPGRDADVVDGGPADTGVPDSGVGSDAGGGRDAQLVDADAPDAEPADAEPADAAAEDAAQPDSGVPPDSGVHPDAGPPADAGFTDQVITDENGNPVTITNGPPGDPVNVGCADGQREGLVDDGVYPDMAACLGTWAGTASLRDPPSGVACGDDLTACAVPGDLCATGWHICGASGLVQEVRQLGPTECEGAGGGRYVTAISHCQAQSGCQYDTSTTAVYDCWASGWCSEPVCCGQQCLTFGACPGGVWPNATHIPVGTDQGCANITSRRAGGVLCCR